MNFPASSTLFGLQFWIHVITPQKKLITALNRLLEEASNQLDNECNFKALVKTS